MCNEKRKHSLEDLVAELVIELKQDRYILTQNKIRAYTLKCANAHKIKAFKATSGWCSRFMNTKILVNSKKKKSRKSCQDDNLFIIGMRKINQYPLHCIGNMDERH